MSFQSLAFPGPEQVTAAWEVAGMLQTPEGSHKTWPFLGEIPVQRAHLCAFTGEQDHPH